MKRLVEVFVDRYYGEYCAHMQELKFLRPKDRGQCLLIMEHFDSLWFSEDVCDDQPCAKYERLTNNDDRLTNEEEPPSSWTVFCKYFGGIQNTTVDNKTHKVYLCCHPEEINKETITHE